MSSLWFVPWFLNFGSYRTLSSPQVRLLTPELFTPNDWLELLMDFSLISMQFQCPSREEEE